MSWRARKRKKRADRDRALDLGLAHHDDDVGDQHRLLRLVQQFDRARAIEDRPLVAEIGRVGDVELGRHLAGARLGGVIADRIAFAHAAAAAGRAAGEQHGFEQRRLARQIRANQGDTAGGARHRTPPLRSGRGRRGGARAAALVHGTGSWRAVPTLAIGIWDRRKTSSPSLFCRPGESRDPLVNRSAAGPVGPGLRRPSPGRQDFYCSARQARSMRVQASRRMSFEVA